MMQLQYDGITSGFDLTSKLVFNQLTNEEDFTAMLNVCIKNTLNNFELPDEQVLVLPFLVLR